MDDYLASNIEIMIMNLLYWYIKRILSIFCNVSLSAGEKDKVIVDNYYYEISSFTYLC